MIHNILSIGHIFDVERSLHDILPMQSVFDAALCSISSAYRCMEISKGILRVEKMACTTYY